MTEQEKRERVELINQLANGFGQSLLTMCKGDWDLALSVSLTLFASTLAQGAINNGEEATTVFEEIGPVAYATVVAFEKEFKEEPAEEPAEESEEDVEG